MKIILHIALSDLAVREKIHHKEITLAGNSRLNIYGHLRCASGKRMKRLNRVFFRSEQEAYIQANSSTVQFAMEKRWLKDFDLTKSYLLYEFKYNGKTMKPESLANILSPNARWPGMVTRDINILTRRPLNKR